ncbi:MAG: hypothetical protein ACOY35_06465 [Bacillota bacterium]|nr:hypothetical protein [Bacillota bacterium]
MKTILQKMEDRDIPLGKLFLSTSIAIVLLLTPLCNLEAAPVKTNKTNILCIWTDRQSLKAVTLMIFDSSGGRIGILSVPVFAHLEVENKQTTVGKVWVQEGRDGLKRRLENALQIQIDGYITFDQPVIEKASTLIGSVDVKGRETTLLQAFEDTRTERRKDDQVVLRAMAANIISPGGIQKVPRLLWLFTTQVNSDIHPELMLRIYKVVSHEGPTILTKKALQGKDYYQDGCRYRYVEPTTWKNIME